jgi:hypothetical protein
MTALRRAWSTAVLPRVGVLAGIAALLGVVSMAAGALLGGGGGRVAEGALAAAVAALGIAVPVGIFGAVASAGRAWVERGAWRALRAAGVAPRAFAVDTALLALVVAVPWSLAEHEAIPRARGVLAAGGVSPELREGATVSLGPARLAREGDTVRILMAPDDGGWTRLSAAGDVAPRAGGVALSLRDVVLEREDGLRVRAARLHGAWVPPVRRGAAERPTATLRPRDAYERWIVWKRTVVPLSACGWAPVALAAGVRARVPALLSAVLCLGAGWGVVRGLDGAVRAGALDPVGAGAALLGVAAVAGVAGAFVLERR